MTASMGVFHQWVTRLTKDTWLPLFVALFLIPVADAQQPTGMPPSVVLVLKLVSTTHVKPATGVVVSDNGLVLVPEEFVSGEGEIVVLDGGVDIARHGRPAKIVNRSSSGGLAVLSVEGLKRQGIKVSEGSADSESNLHLAAFPPAEYLAKGAQPLWVPVKLLSNDTNGPVAVSSETPLPFVSGPIIDGCGYLAGVSLATGTQSLETGKNTVTLFSDDLRRILNSMPVTISLGNCMIPGSRSEALQNINADNNEVMVIPGGEQSLQEHTDSELPDGILQESSTQGPAEENHSVSVRDSRVVTRTETTRSPSIWLNIPVWLWLAGFMIMAILIWKAIYFFRLGKGDTRHSTEPFGATSVQAASEEPGTTQLYEGIDDTIKRPRSAPPEQEFIPDLKARPEGCDGLVRIEVKSDTGSKLKQFCFVNSERFEVVIGRGEADISIDLPAISRAHARLESHAGFMTLSDLGSSNGTTIRGTPCLPGEVMFIETEDEIFLGDVQIEIHLVRQQAVLA